MTKYRIKKDTLISGDVKYRPQKRQFIFLWLDFLYQDGETMMCSTYDDAKKIIDNDYKTYQENIGRKIKKSKIVFEL